MNCAVHPEAEASGYCRNCGKPMCANCVRPVKDVFYCEDCLARVMGVPVAPPVAAVASDASAPPVGISAPQKPPAQTAGNPGIAFLLGLVPGLGAIYNGEYNKALIHIVVFSAFFV